MNASMILPSVSLFTHRAFFCLCVAFSLTTLALPLRAEELPKFSAPEVNDYVKKFAELTDAYVKAIKAKDEAKMKEIDARGKELDATEITVRSKLKPEEIDVYDRFMAAQAQKMMDAANAVTP